jgi:uncharacterized protein
MMHDIALTVRLQTLDGKIANLEHEAADLPKQIAEIEKKLEAHKRRLEIDKAALSANQRDRKKLEGDMEVHEQKISKLKDQMLQAKTNEQYRAFQNEISYFETEIRKAEDKILEHMEQSEPLDKNVKAAEVDLKREGEVVEKEKLRVRERIAALQKSLADFRTERANIVQEMGTKLNADYERIRKKTRGTVIADATDARCGACMISLRPQFMQELKKGETVMHCESCGRILTYNPPVAFENNIGPAATTA